MLINFSVANFLSFNDRQELSMISGKVRRKAEHIQNDKNLKLLKFAAIFGANASGKSNLVSAFDFSQALILNGFPPGAINEYCKINPENKTKPSTFEFEIKIGKNYYAYGFDVIINQRTITGEWLYQLNPKQPENLIFEREPQKGIFNLGQKFKTSELDTVATFLKTNTTKLYLHEINENKGDLYETHPEIIALRDVYRWFRDQLNINYPGFPLLQLPYLIDKNNLPKINTILTSLGLGIDALEIVSTEMIEIRQFFKNRPEEFLKILTDLAEKIQIAKNNGEAHPEAGIMLRAPREFFILRMGEDTSNPIAEKLRFQHKGNNAWFDLKEESDGTRRMIELLDLIFAAESGNSKVYIIDEIDRSLHPQLTYRLIETYLNLVDRGDMQLIVTTHESHIMDLRLLRRDEIWFVEKNRNGESKLYSLDKFTARFDKKVDKAYLEGRYGSVPVFDTFFPMHAQEQT
ncbi:ATP/GTP-binding protein [Methanorbis furvi]|uniref:ATPase AAA-type core domain-containing protein n=1 Tax=Methanorbis furvi TaxID=3028299 RepID=A0AAE4MCD7_9EURY|nr:hypothetical protein [Methanocorpusculaceae archaeon Ag1]